MIQGAGTPAGPARESPPSARADEAVESVMRTLLSNPTRPLGLQFNSTLLRIFESYRLLNDEIEDLNHKLHAQALDRQKTASQLRQLQGQWRSVIQDHKDEVKRLEVILANVSKRGIAEVTLARQSSKIRFGNTRTEDFKKSIFELLEGTNQHEDVARTGRQPVAAKVQSDDFGDSDETISTRKHNLERPASKSFSGNVSLNPAKQSRANDSLIHPESTSDESISEFSIEEHLQQSRPDREVTAASGCEGDMLVPEQLADIIGRRRNLDMNQVMPQSFQLIDSPSNGTRSRNTPDTKKVGSSLPPTNPSLLVQTGVSGKRHSVVAKASGFFHRLKPHADPDTVRGGGSPSSTDRGRSAGVQGSSSSPASKRLPQLPRRFSFDPGDDTAVAVATSTASFSPNSQGDHLRKVASMSSLANSARAIDVAAHSRSSLSQNPGWSQSPCRIPAPINNAGSLARPRSERDGSKASLVTVIEHAEEVSLEFSRTSSSSEVCRSPSRNELGTRSKMVTPKTNLSITGGDRLASRTDSLYASDIGFIPPQGTQKRRSLSDVRCESCPPPHHPSVQGSENMLSTPSSRRGAERD